MNKTTLTKENREERTKKINKKLIPVVIGLFLLLFVLIFIPKSEGLPDKETAQQISRNFIKQSLIDPRSADFIDNNLQYSISEDSVYLFKGVVKATNKMGLHAPSEYLIKMKWTGGYHSDRNNWILLDLQYN